MPCECPLFKPNFLQHSYLPLPNACPNAFSPTLQEDGKQGEMGDKLSLVRPSYIVPFHFFKPTQSCTPIVALHEQYSKLSIERSHKR